MVLTEPEANLSARLATRKQGQHDNDAQTALDPEHLFDYGTVDQIIQPYTPLTPTDRATIASLYRDQVPVKQIAQQFGIHRYTVREIAKEVGLPPHPRGLDDSQAQQAASMYTAGASLATVGQRFGVDAWTVRSSIAKLGVTIRPRKGGRQRRTT